MDEEYTFTLGGRSFWLVSEDYVFTYPKSVAHLRRVDTYEARSLVRAELHENPQRLRAHLSACFSGQVSGLSAHTPKAMWEAYVDTKLLDDWMPSHGLYERAWANAQVRVPVQALAPTWTPEPTDWIEVAFVDQDSAPVPNVAYETELADGRVVRGTTGNTGLFRTDGPPGTARVTFRPNAGGAGGAQLTSFPGTHEIRQGQDMVSIAWAYGRSDWEAIWNDSHNDALREAHDDPRVLMPGARVYIPEDSRGPESFAMGQRHEVRVEVPQVTLDIILGEFLGDVLDGLAYRLHFVAGGADHVLEGETSGEGRIEQTVPLHAQQVRVALLGLGMGGGDLVIPLELRALDPLKNGDESVKQAAARERLENLGFMVDSPTADSEAPPNAAMQLFQKLVMGRDNEEATGDLDAESIDRLLEEHGA
ncbi:MAG: carboxypeptidase-like regulatory domain-containing protein [Polyangiales bacterium]